MIVVVAPLVPVELLPVSRPEPVVALLLFLELLMPFEKAPFCFNYYKIKLFIS